MKNILIFHEGESERIYIDFLMRKYEISKKELKIRYKKEGLSKKLIDTTISELRKNDYDNIFIVCDREEDFPNIEELENCEKILKEKNSKFSSSYKDKIKLLVSNPSFEVWLLFHLTSFSCKSFTNKNLNKKLSDISNVKYEKANEKWLKKFIFNDDARIDTAVNNSMENNKAINSAFAEKYCYSETNFNDLIIFIKNFINLNNN